MVSSLPIFSDTQTHWANPFIAGLLAKGIVSGFGDRTFRPDRTMTRAEFAAILQKAFTRSKMRQYLPFSDVSSKFWAAGAIQTAFETGFLSGFPNRRFLPQNNITRIQVLVSLMAGLEIASILATNAETISLSEIYKDVGQIPAYAIDAIATATFAQIVVNAPNIKLLNPNRGATRGEVAAAIYQTLVFLEQAPTITSKYIVSLPSPPIIRSGTKVAFNGTSRQALWSQWSYGKSNRTGIADAGIVQLMGIDLLKATNETRQPARWFSPESNPRILPILQHKTYRYLDITALANTQNWLLRVDDNTLNIVTESANIDNVTVEEESSGSRIILNLNRPAPIQLRQQNSSWTVTIEAKSPTGMASLTASPDILERFKPHPIEPPPINPTPTGDKNEGETGGSQEKPLPPILESNANQTIVRGNLPDGLGIRVSTLAEPDRAVIELGADIHSARDILWTQGLRWRQQYLQSGTERFPVVWLSISLVNSGFILRPISATSNSMTGISPLMQIADKSQVLAAVNGGFFNRNNRLPLGAIRRENQWLSGPILNRAAVAWNDAGAIKIGRLTLEETLITSSGQRLPMRSLNSGFVQAGIARYTPEWGATYTPLSDNEILVAVSEDRVTSQILGGAGTKAVYTIPPQGYLLSLRSNSAIAESLNVGTRLEIESRTVPSDFNLFPHILGAGPLLLQQGQIVLDTLAEGFSEAFRQQAAIRSCLGVTVAGELIIATIHNRIGGRGPTLIETAQLMQQLGAIEALNLDGGSSTSLYLGGQLLNRLPDTAASVHNGLGILRG